MWSRVREVLVVVLGVGTLAGCGQAFRNAAGNTPLTISLPAPRQVGPVSVEESLAARRSERYYRQESLALAELAQLLWAAQGITIDWGGRTAPSAGATYPLEVFAVVGAVEGLAAGMYQYLPAEHSLVHRKSGDLRTELSEVALGQPWVREAPFVLVIAAQYERTTQRYGERGIRYVHIEVGHVGQNVYLQAGALGLGTVAVGAFSDDGVKRLLEIEEDPLMLMPIGRPN